MSGFRFLSLELRGFGRHERVRLGFPDGLGVLVAPNESGKSTAVAGLTAVLFGLPTSSNPEEFGHSRYRNLSGGHFAGTLRFRGADGLAYELTREFEGHKVRLALVEPGSEKVLFDGTHNPRARRSAGKYEAQLQELTGLSSADLYRQTNSFEQPLLGIRELSSDVARLLAGSGGATPTGALDSLEERIKGLTMFTRELQLPGNNKRKAGLLEKASERLDEVLGEIAEGKNSADGLQKLQLKLAGADEKLEELREEGRQNRDQLNAAEEYLRRYEAYRAAFERATQLETKVTQAQATERRIEELDEPGAGELEQCRWEWEFAGSDPHSYLLGRREEARRLQANYGRFTATREALKGLEGKLERYALFAPLAEEQLQDVRDAPGRILDLEGQLEGARQELEQRNRELAGYNPKRGYEDVADLSGERIAELQAAAQGRGVPQLPLAFMTAAATVAGLYLLAGVSEPWLLVIAALAAGGATWFGLEIPRRRRDREAQEANDLLQRREQYLRSLESLPPPPDPEPFAARVEELEGRLAAARELLLPYQEQHPDIVAAVGEYRMLQDQVERNRERLGRYAEEYWNVPPGRVDGLPLDEASAEWQRCARLLTATGSPAATVSELAQELAALDEDGRWEELLEDARRWQARQLARKRRLDQQGELRNRLQGLLQGEGVETSGELEKLLAQRQTEASVAHRHLDHLLEQFPSLPDPESDGVRDEVRRKVGRLRERGQELAAQVSEQSREIHRLNVEIAQLQGDPANIAALEEEAAQLRTEIREHELDRDALALAYQTLSAAITEYEGAYLERLAQQATEYFQSFTHSASRRVELREGFQAVIREGSAELQPGQLSQGAQDQLALAVRLAVADMLSDSVKLPLLFDDPFLNCDDTRLGRIREALQNLAASRQVILLSHDPRFSSWGEPIEFETPRQPELSFAD